MDEGLKEMDRMEEEDYKKKKKERRHAEINGRETEELEKSRNEAVERTMWSSIQL